MTYKFKYADMEFSKDGSLDELIALDRYAIPTFDNYQVGDTVVAIVDTISGTKKVGEITSLNSDSATIKTRDGESHNVEIEYLQKPLETKPVQFWERWAKGGASVEKTPELQKKHEQKFRKLLDGYGYSLGGRIQLMLGQEFVTGVKANLTAYNCYVVKTPEGKETPLEQFLEVLFIARKEASIMRRGGGVGTNISKINTVNGSGANKTDFIFYLDKKHKDFNELLDRKLLGKFKNVTVAHTKEEFNSLIAQKESEGKGVHIANAIDSVDGLFDGLDSMVNESYKGNTVAINFNPLRHRNAIVKGVNGRSSGAVSWMELYVLVAELLQQERIDNVEFAEIFSHIVHLIIQGGSRRGALMLVCNDDSPNIRKFIERKKTSGKLTGANISVGVSDSFMMKVKGALKLPNPTQEQQEALELWNLIIESAWASAEPGVIFLERYNKESNSWYYNAIEATNPCGEQGLPYWGVCNLGHFVLPRYFNKETKDVDWKQLREAVHTAVRLQDNIIDYTKYFLKENEEVQKNERRVGIGSMGLGTLLILKGLRYGSEKGNEFVDKLYKFIAVEAYKASIDLAEEKGAFPKFEYDKYIQSGFMQRLLPELPKKYQEKLKETGIRNVTILTQAPTGSTGTYTDNIPEFRKKFGGTTTGIEPYFSWKYWRAGRLGITEQTVDLVKDYMEEHGIENIEDLPDFFVTANDLSPADHVKVQATIQKWTDSSISKTANCPKDYTIEETADLYMLSYDLGLKGMTIYRDGSRDAQVLATNEEDAKLESHIEAEELKKLKSSGTKAEVVAQEPIQEPVKEVKSHKIQSRLFGMREKVRYQSGEKFSKAYVHIYVDENDTPVEVFIVPTNDADRDMADALGRMTTQFLRFGATKDNIEQAVKHLQKGKSLISLPYIVGRLLNDVYYGKIDLPTKSSKKEDVPKKFEFAECVDCGEKAYDKGNCICHACGISRCN